MTSRSRGKRTGSAVRQPQPPRPSAFTGAQPAPAVPSSAPLTLQSWPAIGLAGVVADQLDNLIGCQESELDDDPLRLGQIERVNRVLSQYPGVAGSSVFDPVCRYLSERIAGVVVWIGDGGATVIVSRADVQVRVPLPAAVVEYRERAVESA